MSLILNGNTGISGVDGSAGTPALQGNDSNTGVSFGTDTVTINTGGVARVTTDASGNVGIGTVSPASKLQVQSGTATAQPAWAAADVVIAGNSAGNSTFYQVISDTAGGFVFSTPTVRARSLVLWSEATGNMSLTNGSTGGILFSTNGSERARIDSSGNLLVGIATDSGGSRLRVRSAGNTVATNCAVFENSSATNVGYIRNDGAWNSGVGAGSPYNLTTGSAANLFVASDGFLYRSTSSLKYKTDVQDSTRGLADVMNLRPVTYKGKNDGDTVFGGLIAEEVHEAGLTEFVQYAEDGSPDALAYGNMVSLAFKAIQEQQAIIQSLTSRLEALENK